MKQRFATDPMTAGIPRPRRHRIRSALLLMAMSCLAIGMPALASATECAPPAPGEPMLVTDQCEDPRFNDPYIDVDEMRATPVPHRYVHGGFTGTDARFSFYFPPVGDDYEGRFFQNTHQLLSSENSAADSTIAFALASGGYYVQTNIGGSERATTPEEALSGNIDPAVGGYRVNAAAARYSREVAAQIYGPHRPYGYLYGGSGGAYQTICSSEHTEGIWDGYVPFVMGSPNAIPGVFTARIHALRVLRQRNKFPEVMDAIDPGGSGDPYAGLDDEEAGALREATRLGFPPRGWWNHATLNGGPLRLVAGYVPLLDPDYSDDYWSLPGYLGRDDPTGSVAAARIQDAPGARTVFAVNPPFLPGFIVLDSVPAGDLIGADIVVDVGGGQVQQGTILVAFGTAIFALGLDLSSIPPFAPARIDNSAYLALQTYHRHQLPTPDMYGWNSLRGEDGEPLYPQREVLIGPIGAFNGAGCITGGDFNDKMILVQNLMDIDAFPWQADWYRTKVRERLGRHVDDRFRLYFTDHAQHVSPSPSDTAAFARTIRYTGVLEHALRDLSAWVEQGEPPPRSTRYSVDEDSQVHVPGLSLLRRGIQPVVHVFTSTGARAEIEVGESVDFYAIVSAPPGAGDIVQAEWDFLGAGDFPVDDDFGDPSRFVLLHARHTFDAAGTYFPVLRATAQREGTAADPFARVQNLGRVRVVVNEAAP